MRPERDYHFGRLLESFSGQGVLPARVRRELSVRVKRYWDLEPPCASADPEAWFPDVLTKSSPGVPRVCESCPVRLSCLVTAILDDDYGIWGGTRRGQRLHARARLLNEDPVDEVLAELLQMPMPDTEYVVPGSAPVEWSQAS